MSKRLSGRDTHVVGITQDASEITGTDIPQPDGSNKRGLDIVGEVTPSGLRKEIKVTTLTVGTSATLIPTSALVDRNSMAIHNKDGIATLYIGPLTVTADDVAATGGWEVDPDSIFSLDITEDIGLYGIVGSGSITVKVLEFA